MGDIIRHDMGRFSIPLLVIALLLGQSVRLAHECDFAAHDPDDTCVTCLHAAPLSDGMVGMAILVVPVAVIRSECHSLDIRVAKVSDFVYRARSPPPVFPA